jgi:hypothetical protein
MVNFALPEQYLEKTYDPKEKNEYILRKCWNIFMKNVKPTIFEKMLDPIFFSKQMLVELF